MVPNGSPKAKVYRQQHNTDQKLATVKHDRVHATSLRRWRGFRCDLGTLKVTFVTGAASCKLEASAGKETRFSPPTRREVLNRHLDD
jgi:hypothetical protein